MKIAFYAPMNVPDEGPPSGDRVIARQLMHGLADLGHEVEIASRLETWSKDPEALAELKERAALDVRQLHSAPFDAWITYHVYYKAPDLIGPWIARARGIPYFVVEGSLSPKRAEGPWAEHTALTREALGLAARIFCTSARDRPVLEDAGFSAKLTDLVPWVDGRTWARPNAVPAEGPLQLVSTAMMRGGDKLESYTLLAKALEKVEGDWRLTIHGDGPARKKVETLFKKTADRVSFAGLADEAALARAYAGADLFVWPGVGEGLGIAYLEAQAAGLPCIACNEPGPRSVLDDSSARFTQTTPDAYAWAIMDVARDEARRATMAKAAKRLTATRFSRDQFLRTLKQAFEDAEE